MRSEGSFKVPSLLTPKSSLACSAVILPRRAWWISFLASSSTSFPSGALVTKSTSATPKSSRTIKSPPRSPSTNTVTDLTLLRSLIVCGQEVPFIEMVFLNPCFSKVRTSARPSTTMSSSLESTSGPAGSRSLPYSPTSIMRTD